MKNWEERTDPALADLGESLSVTSTTDEHLPPGGPRPAGPELLLDLGGRTSIIPRYFLFLPFLADPGLLQRTVLL